MQAVGIISGAIIAVAGWIVSQYRARREVRRNMRINYLLDAYRRLERSTNREEMSVENKRDLEEAYADIQLLGSPAQVELAQSFARELTDTKGAMAGPLLDNLRMSLRRELLLEAVPPVGVWLRMERGSEPGPDRRQLVRTAVARRRK